MVSIAFIIIVACITCKIKFSSLKENLFTNYLYRQKRSVLKYQSSKWYGGIVPYQFINGSFRNMTESEKMVAKQAMFHIQSQTCIQFIPSTNEKTYLRIERVDMGACESPVGYYSAKIDSLKFGESCNQLPVMVHELMHVLGFGHEHQRIDRDKYIMVNFTNVQNGYANQFELDNVTYFDTQNIPYDINSVMHYQNFIFSKFVNPLTNSIVYEHDFMTMYALSGYALLLGNNYGLTPIDVLRISLRYDCNTSSRNTAKIFTSNARIIFFNNILFIYCLLISFLIFR